MLVGLMEPGECVLTCAGKKSWQLKIYSIYSKSSWITNFYNIGCIEMIPASTGESVRSGERSVWFSQRPVQRLLAGSEFYLIFTHDNVLGECNSKILLIYLVGREVFLFVQLG